MWAGILSGITWAIETIVLGIALAATPFVETEQAIILAPFVSTFLHDAFSAIWATVYNAARGDLKHVWHVVTKSKGGKYVMLAAVIGGPVGMTGYALTVRCMGASIGAVASSIFPAIGAVLAFFFLKEKMQWYRWIFLFFTLLGVYGLSYSPQLEITDFWMGFAGALMCSFGWGIETVILAKSLQDPEVKDEYALQIRQTTSAIVNGLIVLPIVKGWGFMAELFTAKDAGMLILTIAIAGFFATVTYLVFFKSINKIGASKAMALNVTYSAWAIVFTVIFLKDTSVLTPTIVLCTVTVIVCGILVAADFKELFGHKN